MYSIRIIVDDDKRHLRKRNKKRQKNLPINENENMVKTHSEN